MSLSVFQSELMRQFRDLFTSPAPNSPKSLPSSSGRALPASPPPVQAPGHARHGLPIAPSAAPQRDASPATELSTDALEQIFLRCDTDTLIGSCASVCKAWRAVASSSSLWRHRLSPKLMADLDQLATLGPPLAPSRLFLIMQGRNFLRNPTFRRDANSQPQLGRTAATSRSKYQRSAWVTTATIGDGVAWEAPPAGMRTYGTASTADPPPPLPYPGGGGGPRAASSWQQQQHLLYHHPQSGHQLPSPPLLGFFGNGSGGFGIWGSAVRGWDEHQPGCLATANDWCEAVQVVDLDWELQRRGLSAAQAAALLDAELSLRLSVHVGARWDCVGQYSVGLLLDEGNGNANGYGYGTAAVDGHHHHPGGLPGAGGGGGGSGGGGGGADDSIPSLQSFVMRPTRHHFYSGRVVCTSDTWQRFEYVLPCCPRGFRRAVVILRGRRAPNSLVVSPMPKYCGAKFASAELIFS